MAPPRPGRRPLQPAASRRSRPVQPPPCRAPRSPRRGAGPQHTPRRPVRTRQPRPCRSGPRSGGAAMRCPVVLRRGTKVRTSRMAPPTCTISPSRCAPNSLMVVSTRCCRLPGDAAEWMVAQVHAEKLSLPAQSLVRRNRIGPRCCPGPSRGSSAGGAVSTRTIVSPNSDVCPDSRSRRIDAARSMARSSTASIAPRSPTKSHAPLRTSASSNSPVQVPAVHSQAQIEQ